EGLRDPIDVGHISSRLLKDPLDTEFMIKDRSVEEKEAHIVGYLKAILQLVYCAMKGLEGWQFSNTPLHEEIQKTQSVGKIHVIPKIVETVKQEISEVSSLEQFKIEIMENILKDDNEIQTVLQKEQTFDFLYRPPEDENTDIPFTARLMAYYRAQECKSDSPLIVDPFAERLAGDMTSYANKHKFVTKRGDYPLVRSHYIEKYLLIPWCNTNAKSQIVLLGAGLDTRAYRFKPLLINSHSIFEIDLSTVINYKEEILRCEQPLCDLVRLPVNLSSPDWTSHLIQNGFSKDIPSFWILEGLAYYVEQNVVISLLKKIAELSTETSQIFTDICVPALADLVFGPFTRHFKWGLDKKAVPSFFAAVGWNVVCSFADDHDQGRDVGQRGLIFVQGVRSSSVSRSLSSSR
ncbi:MAG: class I SAM-dependent methyltransferase, partial [Candidatus Hodarchaeota archaeon]